ncbi:C4-dicarboxylate transport sensor protein DctB [Fundidesulfovibrio magnetotacticus]|uniref:histidine kinase n=1 Tax=Fundidesulfovibrio magnetotacticus TaxID=2730080 RepID=A0A6V8LT13_9BACT|nr:DUF3365 domain-containing protein [Fundidesulfovibrio magnetotacticus]GFK93219.1 C4-dicarboxylate transport sensor protein DctB [Fundidesulfovibrio magnetotacticus]
MKKAKLKTMLVIRLLAVTLGIGLVFGVSLNHYLRVLLETEVADKAQMVLSHVLAIQTYVRETLRPTMYETLPPDSFVIEAMSTSYVTRKVLSDLNTAKDKYTYRRVALDPRNPEYGADPREAQLIAHFRENPDETQISRYYTENGEEYFMTARPVVFEEACLSCHGRPADAPKVLLARYGDQRGFGRVEGEVAGLDSIIMPVESEAAAINRAVFNYILVFAMGTLLIIGVNHLFFDRMTVVNIGRLAALMRSRFPAEAGRTLDNAPRRERDEIEGMIEDMERFADHLRDAKEQLRDYAANLEAKVAARTAQATAEAEARGADVALFLHVLELFVKGADRARLLDEALRAVAGRFEARAAGFCCFYSMNVHAWPQGAARCPNPDQQGRLLEGESVFSPGQAWAPVLSAGSVRGGLWMGWDGQTTLEGPGREVFKAVGRQLSIALENLEAMENVLRQKAVLESIFEGIADPLFLISSTGEVLHANEGAQTLLSGLGGGSGAMGFAALAAECASGRGEAIAREAVLPDGRSLTLRAYPMDRLAGSGRAIVYARDNTAEKTMLAKLQQSEKSMAMSLLAAGMAHEINNPLGVILCYARLLWDDGQSPHAQDLDIIIRHTLQARKVLEDLMRFARPRHEAQGAASLAESVEFIARVFRGKALRSATAIEVSLPPDLPPVLASSSALEQILTNLLLNALDAIEEAGDAGQGLVRIGARLDAGASEVVLTVADNGPGIPEEHLRRIFDPFFTTKSVGKGTGLGLAVVYGLVRDLDGAVDVSNDGGAVFAIRLPLAPETPDD